MAINIDIPAAQITNAIAVGIAEAFSAEKRDALLRDIVRAHLSYREQPYDKETLLGKQVGRMVRDIAAEKVAEMVSAWKDEVAAIVAEELGPQFSETVFEQLRDCLRNLSIANLRVIADTCPH